MFDRTGGQRCARCIAKGLPAGPGAAIGQNLFECRARGRSGAHEGEKVLLVRIETSPEDLRGMIAAEGILTARGGVSSHAALVARQMGKVCVCGASALQIDYAAKTLTRGRPDVSRKAISSPSTARRAKFMRAKSRPRPRKSSRCWSKSRSMPKESPTYQNFAQLMDWCGKVTRLQVRTNADTPEQTANADRVRRDGHRPVPHGAYVL